MKNTPKIQKNKTKKPESEAVEPYTYGKHIPVLLDAVLNYLDPREGESYLDLTAGYGGHADAILGRTLGFNHTYLVDRDQNAIDYLKQHYEERGVEILHSDFLSSSKKFVAEGIKFDIILADLGVSSPHLDNMSRGFSLKHDGPLDMRMDEQQATTAETIINEYTQEQLAQILRQYGEEPQAHRIARAIVADRPLHTTKQLADLVRSVYGYRSHQSRVHPATRTFQALRIAVNDELNLLRDSLPLWVDLLSPGGRIAVISFHSLEDRIVKQTFAQLGGNRYDAVLTLLTKQPVSADDKELVFNPRARSAKLRAALKNKN